MYTVLLLALLFWTDMALPSCLQPMRSSCQMQLIPATLINAQRLYSIPLQTLLKCFTRCLQDVTCFYTVVSELEKQCTLYQIDVTIQNVTKYKTYGVILKDLNVSIYNYLVMYLLVIKVQHCTR